VQARPSGGEHALSAKGDPYSVTVPVDASAASASAAQNIAIKGGRVRAWTQLSHRLVPQKEWAKLPALDDAGLERLIRGYTAADEKRSTTRYIARITYIFNPDAVRHLFRIADIGYATQTGTAILLVPMSPTYAAQSPWAKAFAQRKAANAQFALVTPVGDNVDQSSLGPLRFASASWSELESAASRVHANEAVLVQAGNPDASHFIVHMRRIGPGRTFVLPDADIPVPAGLPPDKLYALAAGQAEAAIEEAWKVRTSIDTSKKARMVAEVRIASLEDWTDLLAKISSIPIVSDVVVVAMNTGEGRIGISYSGTPEQLRDLAAQSGLTLASRDGFTWVSRGKPAAAASVEEQ
jgi:Uncharacterized protein conserved in bacteria (DUF2066)